MVKEACSKKELVQKLFKNLWRFGGKHASPVNGLVIDTDIHVYIYRYICYLHNDLMRVVWCMTQNRVRRTLAGVCMTTDVERGSC